MQIRIELGGEKGSNHWEYTKPTPVTTHSTKNQAKQRKKLPLIKETQNLPSEPINTTNQNPGIDTSIHTPDEELTE